MEHNPYEAPASAVVPDPGDFADEARTSLERDLGIFAGRRAAYYLRKWTAALEGTGSLGFNWWAFLLAVIWIPYRKMYRVAFLFCGFFLAEEIAESMIVALSLGTVQSAELLGNLAGLVACIYVGGKANGWYLQHARKVIAEVRSKGLPDEEYRIELARRGGTSLLGGFGVFILFLVAIFVLMMVQDYLGLAHAE